tara:strand:- start:1295 stop:1495 length:201 start_codon:yes stop_codon:yes gene_type:complete
MTWDYYDIKKDDNNVYDRYRPIDATSMHLPKYKELKIRALYDLLLKHYSMPDLEQALIERMETILN